MSEEQLLISREGDVLHLRLNRPERLNALSAGMRDGLIAVFREQVDAPRETAGRSILISAAGKGFCSGADIAPELILARRGTIREEMEAGINQLVMLMRRVPVPVIVAMQGAAAGAGFSIALCADLMLVAPSARLVMAFSRIGAVMDGGASHILQRRIGAARASAITLLGQTIDAEQAVSLGLAIRQCGEDELQAEAEALAAKLAAGPTRALGLIKAEIEYAQSATLNEALSFEAEAQAEAFASDDFEEGITAFAQKRKPQFRGV